MAVAIAANTNASSEYVFSVTVVNTLSGQHNTTTARVTVLPYILPQIELYSAAKQSVRRDSDLSLSAGVKRVRLHAILQIKHYD